MFAKALLKDWPIPLLESEISTRATIEADLLSVELAEAKRNMQCPNEGCHAIYPRSSAKEHMAVCPFARLQCPFYEFGCRDTYLRSDQDLHHAQNAQFHAALTVQRVSELGKLVKALKKDVTKLKGQVTRAENTKTTGGRAAKRRKTTAAKGGRGRGRAKSDGMGFVRKQASDKFTSSYHGVYWNKSAKRWVSQIVRDGKQEYLGLFKNEVDAARAYDEKAKHIEGKKINFVD